MKLSLPAAVLGAAIILCAAPAQANPATPQSAIDAAAAQVCQAAATNPTEAGITAALDGHGFDDMDGAYTLITAIHHVCPQHEDVLMGIISPVAEAEICKPS